ncbi:hypothetical protein DFH29DRAFT_1007121 [Suillus ampliporus]|nr:hypothetical protein DFH29DRAFT_1007121 [Suillus ampliporus]
MSIPDIEVKCFLQHVVNSIYDCVTNVITSHGKDGLGKANFGIYWTTTVQDNYSGTNWLYVNTKDSHPFRTNIVGQIATSACSMKHSVKDTLHKKGNSGTVKWKWAFSKPILVLTESNGHLGESADIY